MERSKTKHCSEYLIQMNKTVSIFACFLFLLLHPLNQVMAQYNSIIGEWIGHWSCGKYDADTDSYSPTYGRNIVRIEKFGDEYNVRVKEIDESAQPPLIEYINGITIRKASDSFIEFSFPCGGWYVWTVKLLLKNNYILMTVRSYNTDINRDCGPECPVVTAWKYCGGRRPFYEIKLYKEDNDW